GVAQKLARLRPAPERTLMTRQSHPPAWAQVLVTLFVPAARRESIVGDLMEEYHEAQVPEHGASSADWWYIRQAAGFLWRAAAPWAGAVGLMLALREAIDATVPTADNFHFRAAVSTYLAFTIFAAP